MGNTVLASVGWRTATGDEAQRGRKVLQAFSLCTWNICVKDTHAGSSPSHRLKFSVVSSESYKNLIKEGFGVGPGDNLVGRLSEGTVLKPSASSIGC